ncbi:MAG: Na/Pi cotransporter family protein [Firmicutes bacterium]|nr:Na/Pi cotransporter family protein [Bacillota bacterium]
MAALGAADWAALGAGLAALLFGMKTAAAGLSQLAAGRLAAALQRAARRPWPAFFAGAAVTAAVQSSSVVTILLVGLADAGLLDLSAAACLVLGANVGTTLTAHLLAFGPGPAAGWLLLAAGLPLARRPRHRGAGRAAAGMGMVILGLHAMEGALAPLGRRPAFAAALAGVAGSPLLGLAAGALMTTLVLSSAVTIGVLQKLVAQGLLSLRAALPVLYGDNVGTTTDTLLASLAAGSAGRRLAVFHLLFNMAGALLFLALTPWVAGWVAALSSSPERQVALAHTLFNAVNAVLWLPARGWLLRAAAALVPGTGRR